ncbi:ERAD-associated protein [Coniosporium apollinis]|uniref:ERAD-associated protein n=1 Tax=Coniosporium apollinis TaxID=61459 RepID=A0ABQ9P7H9_9PEZI|nr:ERAD-associated protein [Coniosporium apollinis]
MRLLLRRLLPLLLFVNVFLPAAASAQAGDVHEAHDILRGLSASTRTSFKKPSGVLGYSVYYAKELFFLLFMNAPPQDDLLISKPQKKIGQPLQRAVKLLEGAAGNNDTDAIWLLAEMNFYGNFTHPRNYPEALRRYQQLAQLDGNSSAQHMVGFMHATGIGGAVKQDQAKAMLYHTFAAEAGDARSQMTMGYRHHVGIATPRNCEEAVYHYKKVADKAIAFQRSGPPGGHMMIKESYRYADEEGGVYGEGASVSSSGPNAKKGGATSDAHAAFDDILEYLDLMSRKGDLKATFSLGKLYYDGSRQLKRDLRAAKSHFLDVARAYWGKDGKIKSDPPPGTEKLASKAAGYLGRMFLRGEGIEPSYAIAQTWFRRGISNGDALCQYSMGLMHLHGLGVPRDPVKAAEYFAPAADQDLASAQVQLGKLFLDQGDVRTATQYFELAARNGHIEAFYYLAELNNQGVGRERSCSVAAVYYKIVAEKAEGIFTAFADANAAYEAGDLETALVANMMAAEQGFEVGQSNVAYLLESAQPRFSEKLRALLPFVKRRASTLASDAALALIYWTRAAKQSNIDAMVKMGDYYLLGLGTSHPDTEKAAACYQAAAETMQSAQALWNLGWMHENGIGVEQDFHLAKRFYDQAYETNEEAYLPVQLSLWKLRVRSWWNGVSGGRVKGIQEEPSEKKSRTLTQWIADFLAADAAAYEDVDHEPDDWDDGSAGDMPGGDDGFYDEIDEGIIESLVIIGLAAALAGLVYWRQQMQLRRRQALAAQDQAQAQAEGQGQNQAQDQGQIDAELDAVMAEAEELLRDGEADQAGLFPEPGDPAWNDWVAGGIGH